MTTDNPTTALQMDAVVVPPTESELIRYPNDEIWLRAAGHGEVQVVEYISVDRDGPPAHSHPWDEVEVVVDGEAEFSVGGGPWQRGGQGTVQLLPAGVSHSVRIPSGTARLIMVTIGAPYDAFARDVARCLADGAAPAELAEVAARHGVRLG